MELFVLFLKKIKRIIQTHNHLEHIIAFPAPVLFYQSLIK